MDVITKVLVLGIVMEALIEYVKLIFVDKKIVWKQVAAIVVGIALAVLAQVDLFSIVGITFISPWVGIILTGVIFSRGSNYVADFISLITNASAKSKIAAQNELQIYNLNKDIVEESQNSKVEEDE